MSSFIRLLVIYILLGTANGKLNILFIIVDDLRPALGCYGDPNARTPYIDLLAKESIVFTQTFAQQSLCAPSRNSLLTGRRPDTLHLYDTGSYWRQSVGNFTTLPEHLKNNGYTTMSIGKVFHPGISSNGSDDSPYSWSEKPFHPYTDRYKNAAVCRDKKSSPLARNLVCPVRVSSMPNKTLPDIETLKEARKFLQKHRNDTKPFFLAVGFQKPHIPLKYPRKFLSLHPIEKFMIYNYTWPKHIGSVAYNPWNDLRKREDVKSLHLKFPWEKIPIEFGAKVVQSYYAAVSYIDSLIGLLLDELDFSYLKENTTVILTSDHGWSLGEHAEWAKYSNFDVALRVPLIISIPGLTHHKHKFNNDINSLTGTIFKTRQNQYDNNDQSKKKMKNLHDKKIDVFVAEREENSDLENLYISNETKIDGQSNNYKRNYTSNCKRTIINNVVELVDLFPTIADIAGVGISTCPAHSFVNHTFASNSPKLCSEGSSLVPLILATLLNQTIIWKNMALSQYPRPGTRPTLHPNSDEPHLKEINIMGYTIRTKQFRYIAWVQFDHVSIQPNWEAVIAEELYDHNVDPDERLNVVQYAKYSKEKQRLKSILRQGWKHVSLM